MIDSREVSIAPLELKGDLRLPDDAYALVAFAHGSGSGRLSPRNTAVARALNERGMATLLFDLLTEAEEADRANVFDIALLAQRLLDALRWVGAQTSTAKLPLGLFGARPALRQRWLRRRRRGAGSAQWSRAAAAPISPARP
jgi:putative phosphoribosyl transferase